MLKTDRPRLTLTGRGRICAVLVTLEARWHSLAPEQQARALELLAELSAAVRRREVRGGQAVPVRVG